jgi:RNA polymerase sigma-70 factor, ECF subfamily
VGLALSDREESVRIAQMTVAKDSQHATNRKGLTPDESQLIAQTLSGATEAFYELIRPHERSVYVAAFSILRNSAEAEDVAQESILKSFRHLSKFRGESKFSTWLLRITMNEARMRLRRQHRELYEPAGLREEDDETAYEPIEFGDWREIPSEALERKEIREVLQKALASLPEIYREVIVLRDVRQLSVAEAAEVIGVGEGTVKTRLVRARLQLRDLVAPFTTVRGLFAGHLFRRGRKPWF